MKAIHGTALAGAAALSALVTVPARAQGVPADRGVPTRDEITRPVAPPTAPESRLRVEGDIERSPCPLADPKYADVRLTLNSATFGNLKGVTAAELESVYRGYLGKNRPASDICEIRDAVATFLRRKGYLAAVQVPPQQIVGGNIRFELLYARLTAIRVRGDAGPSEKLVAAYLEKLTQDEVFNQRAAERYLLLARDLPGIEVRLALKPAGRPGEVYGEVTLVRTPVQADLNVQNFGAASTGRFGGQARLLLNGLTGLGDQTSIAFYSTADFREQQVLQLGHQFRVGSEGLEFAGRFTYAWTRPDLAPGPDVLRARTSFGTIEARYPLLRTQGATVRIAGGLDLVNQKVRFAGTGIADDKLRVAYLRLDGDVIERRDGGAPRWHLGYSLESRQGLGIFDATKLKAGATPPSRIDGDARATVVRAAVNGDAALLNGVTFSLAASGQHAFDPLLAFEEYSAGTYTIGRGYDPGTLLGDDGVGLSAELRVDRLAPFGDKLTLQPFVFADVAKVWNRNGGIDDDLLSVGGGVRTGIADRFRLDMTLAVPTRAAGLQTRKGDVRLLVSLTTKLWPWGAR